MLIINRLFSGLDASKADDVKSNNQIKCRTTNNIALTAIRKNAFKTTLKLSNSLFR